MLLIKYSAARAFTKASRGPVHKPKGARGQASGRGPGLGFLFGNETLAYCIEGGGSGVVTWGIKHICGPEFCCCLDSVCNALTRVWINKSPILILGTTCCRKIGLRWVGGQMKCRFIPSFMHSVIWQILMRHLLFINNMLRTGNTTENKSKHSSKIQKFTLQLVIQKDV